MDKKIQLPNDIFFASVVEDLRRGLPVTIPMRGVSMLPMLREGRDCVMLQPLSAADNTERGKLRVGDVALFHHKGRYVLHRCAGIRGDVVHMHGDGLLGRDEVCRRSDVVATVSHVIRNSTKPLSTRTIRWRLASRIWLFLRPLLLRLSNFLPH